MNREQRRKAQRELTERARQDALLRNAPAEQFSTPEEANAALAQQARVLNMREHQKEKQRLMAKEQEDKKKTDQAAAKALKAKTSPGLTKDGRVKLPPLPKKTKEKPLVECACGCGHLTKSKFAPGHDSRHRGWILRVERGFVKLADIPDGEREAVAKAIKERKKAGTNEGGKNEVKVAKKKVEEAEVEEAVEGSPGDETEEPEEDDDETE